MDRKRLRVGDWLTGAAGVALLASLWLDWFGAEVSAGALDRVVEYGASVSAWEAFSLTDVVLAVAALGGMLTLVLAATNDSPARPVASGVVTLALSTIAVVAVINRVIINEPGPNGLIAVEPGAYLGAALTFGLFAACLDAVRDESSPHQEPIAPTQLPAPPRH